VLAGGPNPAGAQALAEVLLSEGTEDALAKGAWRSRPVVGASPATDARLADLTAAAVDWDKAVDALPDAVALGLELMKG
jgi:ABC-type Fe3+ transport system substrate-binding protein